MSTGSGLVIRLFGYFEARIGSAPLLGLRLREGERLLAYLTLHHGIAIPYRTLAQTFWPAEARMNPGLGGDFPNTRQAVRFLRRALGAEGWRLASVGKGIVRLNLEGADVDVLEFDRLIRSEAPADWKRALDYYRGPLLAGWQEKWAVDAAVRREHSHRRLLERLADEERIPSPDSLPERVEEAVSSDITSNPEPVGGAVPLDSRYYIRRSVDCALSTALARRDSIVLLKGARQAGKTSLLARGMQEARESGARVVLTDFQKLNQEQLATPDSLFLALAHTMAIQLELDASPRQTWDPDLGPNMNLEIFLRRKILGAFPEPLVWGMDEVDRLFPCGFGSEVFGLFRSWHNERSLNPAGPWGRLTMAIAYATEAHLFITDLNQSPFNVGTRLLLEDFGHEEVSELNRRYGEPLKSSAEIEKFHALVGGQPYLVQRGLQAMTANGIALNQIEAEGDHDEGPFGDHLRRLLVALSRSPELVNVVRGLIVGQRSCASADFYRLRTAGLLAGESSQDARFRCRLYAAYMERHLA